VTNLHPTDFAYEIRIHRTQILAGSVTSLVILHIRSRKHLSFILFVVDWSWCEGVAASERTE